MPHISFNRAFTSSIPPSKKSQTSFIIWVWDEYKVVKAHFDSIFFMKHILKLTVISYINMSTK